MHQRVLLEHANGHGDLYFFTGKEPNDASLRVLTTVEVDAAPVGTSKVVYS